MNKQEFELMVCLFYQLDKKGTSVLADNFIDYLAWDEYLEFMPTLSEDYGYMSARTLLRKWGM